MTLGLKSKSFALAALGMCASPASIVLADMTPPKPPHDWLDGSGALIAAIALSVGLCVSGLLLVRLMRSRRRNTHAGEGE